MDDALAAKNFRVIKLNRGLKAKWDEADGHGKTLAVADAWLNDRKYLDKKGVAPTTKAGLLLGELKYTNNYVSLNADPLSNQGSPGVEFDFVIQISGDRVAASLALIGSANNGKAATPTFLFHRCERTCSI